MNYIEKRFEEIFEYMLEDSASYGFISHADDFQDFIANRDDISNYYVMDKSVIAKMFEMVYQDITRVYESAKGEYAENGDLDDIGKTRGVLRPEATKSTVNVNFNLPQVNEEDIIIPEGFVIATDSGVQYETIKEMYFPAGKTSIYAQCMSKNRGPDTKVNANSLKVIVSNNPYNLTCNNFHGSSGCNPAYGDDEYRYFLMNWFKIHLKGSLESFEYYFASLDGVDDYRIVPNWDGSGTIKIIVDPGDSSLLEIIYEDLKKKITQIDDIVVLFKPVDKFISVNASVNVDIDVLNPYSEFEKEDIKSRIVNAIKVFIDGGTTNEGEYYPGLGLGEDFIPHKLAVFLDNQIPELKNITFLTPQGYFQILDDEKGISENITIEMI